MAKTAQQQSATTPARRQSQNSRQLKGIRKRKWGKWVSEVRVPNSRERIWLGTYHTPQQAARAFDAAVYCLRGRKAEFNFPENPPEIPSGSSLTRNEIRAAAAEFAMNGIAFPSVDDAREPLSPSPSVSSLSCGARTEIELPFEWECWESLLAVAQTDEPSNLDIFADLDMPALDPSFPSASLQNGGFAVDETDLWS